MLGDLLVHSPHPQDHFPGMDPLVPQEVHFAGEASLAVRAVIRPLSRMDHLVPAEAVGAGERLPAHGARWEDLAVSLLVPH